MPFLDDVARAISDASGEPVALDAQHSVGGGCINEAFVLDAGSRQFFLKSNSASLLDMFEAEAEGLREMQSAQAIRVPQPLCTGLSDGRSFLVLEHLPLGGRLDHAQFGGQLAAMHLCSRPRFGWHRDNYIGSTAQLNAEADSWVGFLRTQRFGYQLELAVERGLQASAVDAVSRLMADLDAFFSDYAPRPALLHGDLWSGNWSALTSGEPVIFDPAVYYGDHEADLAMMELFGSPSPSFFAAYREVFPIDAGYVVRKELYNLYHILNHFNLFGGGYGAQAGSMAKRLLGQI